VKVDTSVEGAGWHPIEGKVAEGATVCFVDGVMRVEEESAGGSIISFGAGAVALELGKDRGGKPL